MIIMYGRVNCCPQSLHRCGGDGFGVGSTTIKLRVSGAINRAVPDVVNPSGLGTLNRDASSRVVLLATQAVARESVSTLAIRIL
jgi:hypothetical protein